MTMPEQMVRRFTESLLWLRVATPWGNCVRRAAKFRTGCPRRRSAERLSEGGVTQRRTERKTPGSYSSVREEVVVRTGRGRFASRDRHLRASYARAQAPCILATAEGSHRPRE